MDNLTIKCTVFSDKSALISVEVPQKGNKGIGYTVYSPEDSWDWTKAIGIAQGRAEKALRMRKNVSPIPPLPKGCKGHSDGIKAFQHLTRVMKVSFKGIYAT